MALYEAARNGCHVECLVTFTPPKPNFVAHPLAFIKLQARALGLRHTVLVVDPPYEKGYEIGLRRLREEMRISTVVTGDIGEVGKYPNWIHDRCRAVGMEARFPLWGRDRKLLLQQLLARGFKAYISCVKGPSLTQEWVGRRLEKSTIAELENLCERIGMDLCGEQGEYHTLVTDGPAFAREIAIESYSRRNAGALTYMKLERLALIERSIGG